MPNTPFYTALLAAALVAAFRPSLAAATSAAPASKSLVLSKIDTDRNRTISLIEATRAALAKFAALDTDNSGALDANELTGIVSRGAATTEDRDKDGTIDKQEYLALVTKLFIAADKDRDGSLDAVELSSEQGRALVALLSY